MSSIDAGFIRYDLAITKQRHEDNIANRIYPTLDLGIDPNLHIKCEAAPNYSDLKRILDTVGRPYNWHLRREYHTKAGVEEISAKLAEPESRRFSFWCNEREVGGAIISNIEKDVGSIFEQARERQPKLEIDPASANKTLEIYKIGLFPEYTKRGWGKHFLPQVLSSLFNSETQPEVVYLNTRDSNHNGVIKFYRGLNMRVINALDYPNDLISEAQSRQFDRRMERLMSAGTQSSFVPRGRMPEMIPAG